MIKSHMILVVVFIFMVPYPMLHMKSLFVVSLPPMFCHRHIICTPPLLFHRMLLTNQKLDGKENIPGLIEVSVVEFSLIENILLKITL